MKRSRGYTYVALVVGLAVMAILMAAVLPLASAESQRDKEAELIFRGIQYAEGIRTFRKRYGRYPTTLKEMFEVHPRTLRKLWKDPMTNSNNWGLITQLGGAPILGGPGPGTSSSSPFAKTPTPTPAPTSTRFRRRRDTVSSRAARSTTSGASRSRRCSIRGPRSLSLRPPAPAPASAESGPRPAGELRRVAHGRFESARRERVPGRAPVDAGKKKRLAGAQALAKRG